MYTNRYELLSVQEIGLSWVAELSTKFKVDKSNAIGGEKPKNDHRTDSHDDNIDGQGQQSVKQRASSIDDKSSDLDIDIQSLWLEWIQRVCCLHLSSIAKVQGDIDKSSILYIRDNGLVSNNTVRAVVQVIKNSTYHAPSITTGLSLLDVLLQRALKSTGPGPPGSTGILANDVKIIPLLFELCLSFPTPQTPLSGPLRDLISVPSLVNRNIYWPVCSLCFILGSFMSSLS
jgi:hypothetical protein